MFEWTDEIFLLYFKLQTRRDNHKMQQEKAKPLSRKQQLAQQTKREQVSIVFLTIIVGPGMLSFCLTVKF